MKEFSLDAILYRENKDYVAHCLEFDIAGTSTKSFEDAYDELYELIQVHIEYAYENDNFEYLYKPAPAKYWNMFHLSEPCNRDNLKTIEIRDRRFKPRLCLCSPATL